MPHWAGNKAFYCFSCMSQFGREKQLCLKSSWKEEETIESVRDSLHNEHGDCVFSTPTTLKRLRSFQRL